MSADVEATAGSSRTVDVGLGLVAVVAAAVAFAWLPRVYFFSDDYLHFYDLVNLPPLAFVLQPHGGHLYVVRNLVYELTHALVGVRTEWIMASVLLTHLVNVWLLFRVIRRWGESAVLAFLGALVWGTSPDAHHVLGWYAVFGQALATTVLLVVLGWAGRHATGSRAPSLRTVLAWVALAWAGAACFGSGIAFGMVLPLVVVLLVPALWADPRTRWALLAAPVGVVTMYLTVPVLHAWVDPLRAEPSVAGLIVDTLWTTKDVGPLLTSFALLVGRGVAGILVTRTGSVENLEIPALVLWGVACAVAIWRGTPGERRRMLAFLVVTGAAYGVVVFGRGFSARLTMEPRYQYYAQAPLMVTICLAVAQVAVPRFAARPSVVLTGALAAAALLLLVRGSFVAPGEWTWPARRTHDARFDAEVRRMASQNRDGVLYLTNASLVVSPVPFTATRFPGYAALFCILHPDGMVAGRPVRIIDTDPDALAGAAGGRCSGTVLVRGAPRGVPVYPMPQPPLLRR